MGNNTLTFTTRQPLRDQPVPGAKHQVSLGFPRVWHQPGIAMSVRTYDGKGTRGRLQDLGRRNHRRVGSLYGSFDLGEPHSARSATHHASDVRFGFDTGR